MNRHNPAFEATCAEKPRRRLNSTLRSQEKQPCRLREIREIIAKIDAAWRSKVFDGLEQCFHEHAVIVGPGYVEYANGRSKCAESYREFATNADVLDYSEEPHNLRIWSAVAVYTSLGT